MSRPLATQQEAVGETISGRLRYLLATQDGRPTAVRSGHVPVLRCFRSARAQERGHGKQRGLMWPRAETHRWLHGALNDLGLYVGHMWRLHF